MALYKNLGLLFVLLVSTRVALSQLSPGGSPQPEPANGAVPYDSAGPSPVPSPSPSPFNDAAEGPDDDNDDDNDDDDDGDDDADAPEPAGPARAPSPVPASSISAVPSVAPAQERPKEAPKEGLKEAPPKEGPAEGADGPVDMPPPKLPPGVEVNPEVRKICSSTDNPDICLATVVPQLKGKTDANTILGVAMQAGFKLAKQGQNVVKKFPETMGTSNRVIKVVKNCRDSYDTAIFNYQNAINAFPRRDKGTMNAMLTAVMTDIGDCEDGFAGVGHKSPVADIAVRLTDMTRNCLSIVALLN